MDTRRQGFLAGLGASFLLALTALFIRFLSIDRGMAPLPLAVWRGVFTSLPLALFLILTKRLALSRLGTTLMLALPLGAVLAVFNGLWTFSVARNGAALATVLVYSSGAFTVLLDGFLERIRPTPWKIAAAILILTGCYLVGGAPGLLMRSTSDLGGLILGLGSGLAYAIYSLVGCKVARKGLGTADAMAMIFAISATLLCLIWGVLGILKPGAIDPGSLFPSIGISGWSALVILALGPTLGGYGLYYVALARLPAGTVNLLVSVEPVFTMILAYFLFHEPLGLPALTGAALVLGGVASLRIGDLRNAS